MKLILPGVPDKWTVKELASSRYERLMKTGVEIYEYAPGFAHAKVYLADGEIAMAGTINMDYRSLVHNFENGVWIYRCDCIESIKAVLLTPLLKASVSMKTKQTGIGFVASFAA